MIKGQFLCVYKVLLLSLLTALSLAVATSASAGDNVLSSESGFCVTLNNVLNTPDGLVSCHGTMAGIRNQTADPRRFAAFNQEYNNGISFLMVYNNKSYACYAPADMQEMWNVAIASSAYFLIQYDPVTGICSNLWVFNGSLYRNASAL